MCDGNDMGRLQKDLLDRIESFCDRIFDVTDVLASTPCRRRTLEQTAASDTSVGANAFETDEAMIRVDVANTLGIVIKELNETRCWLRLLSRRGWVHSDRLLPLQSESNELRKIVGAIVACTRNPLSTAQTNH